MRLFPHGRGTSLPQASGSVWLERGLGPDFSAS